MATLEHWTVEGRIRNRDDEQLVVSYDPNHDIEVKMGNHAVWLTLDQAHELQRILGIMEHAQAGVQ